MSKTPLQIAEAVIAHFDLDDDFERKLLAQVENDAAALEERVRLDERERCAEIADEIASYYGKNSGGGMSIVAVSKRLSAEQVAMAIRATPESEGE